MPQQASTNNDDDLQLRALNLYGCLNIPPAQLSLRTSDTGKEMDIFDPLRRRWVALTPEEWVRQHFVAFMIHAVGVSPFRMANEVSLKLNGTARRIDTVVYDNALHPAVIIEYKAPHIPLTKAVLEQALRYNLVCGAPTIIITNGLDVYTCRDGALSRGLPQFIL